MKYTITSLLLFVLLTAGCNNQPQNTQNDIATPVSVTKLKKGSISKLVNTSHKRFSCFFTISNLFSHN